MNTYSLDASPSLLKHLEYADVINCSFNSFVTENPYDINYFKPKRFMSHVLPLFMNGPRAHKKHAYSAEVECSTNVHGFAQDSFTLTDFLGAGLIKLEREVLKIQTIFMDEVLLLYTSISASWLLKLRYDIHSHLGWLCSLDEGSDTSLLTEALSLSSTLALKTGSVLRGPPPVFSESLFP